MADRFYPLYLRNPLAKPIPEDVLHEYGLVKVGEEISATTVTSVNAPNWPMLYSAVALTKEGRNFKLEWAEAADRGSRIHEFMEGVCLWGFDQMKAEDAGDESDFAAQGLEWWKIFHPHPIEWEFLIWSRTHGYAGRADLLASVGTRQTLIDWKTVKDKTYFKRFPKAFDDNRKELVARAEAMRQQGRRVDQLMIVRFAPDGHDTYVVPVEDQPALFAAFLRDLEDYKFAKRDKASA